MPNHKRVNTGEREDALCDLRTMLEVPGAELGWEEVEAALRKLPGRVLLNLVYRVEHTCDICHSSFEKARCQRF